MKADEQRSAGRRSAEQQRGERKGQRKVENCESQQALDRRVGSHISAGRGRVHLLQDDADTLKLLKIPHT